MAVKPQRVINDTPSEVVDELRRNFNALLVLIEAAADLAAVQTGLGDGTVRSVTVSPSLPDAPKMPVL